jgi:hypothetical protein
MHHLADQGDHPLEVRSLRLQRHLLEETVSMLATRGYFFGEALGLAHHPSGVVHELAKAGLEAFLAWVIRLQLEAGDLPDLIANGTRAIAQSRAQPAISMMRFMVRELTSRVLRRMSSPSSAGTYTECNLPSLL